jgi:2-oxoglutarate dehydrogenase E2 component (dihydrolipoamide succinyltransferase)
MAIVNIVIPNVGESVTSGVVGRWLKADGDVVAHDDIVMELETDKVMMEVRAPAAGKLKQLAKEGDTVAVGASVATVDDAFAGAAKPAAEARPAEAKPAEARPAVEAKGSPAPAKAETAAKAGATAKTETAAVGAGRGADAESNGHAEVRATPLARKLAGEHGVDLSKISGTGAGHRVREQDVLEFVKTGKAEGGEAERAASSDGKATTPPPRAASPAGVTAQPGGVSRERMSPLRQRIASRLVEAQHTAAMLTTFNECDMSAVMDLRKGYKEEFEKKHGIGLGFMSFFVKACVQGLRAFPLVNASLVEEGGQIMIEKHESCDIAVAVSTPRGLVVPVLRRCQDLSMAAIESGIKDMAVKARDGKLALEDLQGGTFTITNGGIYGSLMSTPILNPPQSAILGMHAIKPRAIEHPTGSGQVAIRPMMYLALSYDHRIIDGAEAVQFLVKVKQGIEDPQRVLLGL